MPQCCTKLSTHWGRDKMDAIFQTTFLNWSSWMKMYKYRLKFHWGLFLRGLINNIQALVLIMAWRLPMRVRLLTHICVTHSASMRYVHGPLPIPVHTYYHNSPILLGLEVVDTIKNLNLNLNLNLNQLDLKAQTSVRSRIQNLFVQENAFEVAICKLYLHCYHTNRFY